LVVLVGLGLLLGFGTPPRTTLLLGVDVRPDEQRRGQVGHTDTILVLAFAPPGRATLVSFPRDLWVSIPGYGPDRLNVAFPLGAQGNQPGAGATLLARTLSAEFGLAVDRWAVVDFRGFATVVDALGGVDVDVPQTIVDDSYPTDDYGTRRLVIPAGRQHFDGAQALAYVRTRAPDSDFGRIARQQQLLLALRARALSLASVPRWPAALVALRQATTSDLSPLQFGGIVRSLVLLPPDRLQLVVVGPELAPPAVGTGGAAVLMPRTAAIRQTLADALAAR
jgi:LCP family protein required for cell wall assembly